MLASSKLLRSYVRAIHRLSGASSVSLFVPSSSTGLWNAILLQEGSAPPVPELLDASTASAFHRSSERTQGPPGGEVESAEPDCKLIRVPAIQTLVASTSREHMQPARRKLDTAAASDPTTTAWIGVRFEDGARGDGSFGTSEWWTWLLALGGALALHVQVVSDLLDDPVTGLPDRAEFQAHLAQALHVAKAGGSPMTLVLLNPENFVAVNERFGRERGDSVLRSIAERLRANLRDVDLVGKYGGAVFAVILQGTSVLEGKRVADKLLERLVTEPYLEGALRLSFSLGLSGFDPRDDRDEQTLSLMRRADQALSVAKRSGGGAVVWKPGTDVEETDGLDRLSGIFTANMAKDYRNMVLLWDTVSVVAKSTDFETLAAQVTERLFATFKPEQVALFRFRDNGALELIHGIARHHDGVAPTHAVDAIVLASEQRVLLEEARSQSRPLQSSLVETEAESGNEYRRSFYAVPLLVEDECLGSLYLSGREGELTLDKSDLIFLRALGGQLAVALDRARLAEQDRQRLRDELKQLRSALRHSKLVYRSKEMESVLALVRRVAPTDATVLINGESGTGKELVAATIHELSPRRERRMEVVDCASIPSTLIESELFGHEAGAFTGAAERKDGRLLLADGGTLVLDEIAELPLEVQSRLLRFVQEKQVRPVGGDSVRRVDVRVLASTHCDLAEEVDRGRFREDLFHRLNVIRIVIPPLRERRDDVLFLADHFLKNFALQYQKPLLRFSPEAERALLGYSWPGNVRELENRIMQATLLGSGPEVGPDDLRLGQEPASFPEPPPAETIEMSLPGVVSGDGDEAASDRAWSRLRTALKKQVANGDGVVSPLGRHLDADFALAAFESAGGVSARAAKLLGIPETTFRRRIRKAQQEQNTHRPDGWAEVRDCLGALARPTNPRGLNRLEKARTVLLEEVVDAHGGHPRRAAAFMGVSLPTYRRWVSKLPRH